MSAIHFVSIFIFRQLFLLFAGNAISLQMKYRHSRKTMIISYFAIRMPR